MKKGLLATVSLLAGAATGAVAMGKVKNSVVDEKTEKIDKFKAYYGMLNGWLSLKQEGKTLATWFEENGYKNVAIYGMGEMGDRLYEELKNTDIKVAYAIDQNSDSIYSELQIYQKEDGLPEVDVIVVSAIFAFDEISIELKKRCSCPVISLEDVVYEA